MPGSKVPGQEARLVEGVFEGLAQFGVAGPELGGEIAAVLLNNLVNYRDGMKGHVLPREIGGIGRNCGPNCVDITNWLPSSSFQKTP